MTGYIYLMKPNDKPWMTSEVGKILRRKNRIHKIAKTNNRPQDWAKFRKESNEAVMMIKGAKSNYISKLKNSLADKNIPPGKWWKIAKSIAKINNKENESYPIKLNNDTLIHTVDKAETLNNFFSSISTSSLNLPDLQDVPPLCNHDFSSINITSQDVLINFML